MALSDLCGSGVCALCSNYFWPCTVSAGSCLSLVKKPTSSNDLEYRSVVSDSSGWCDSGESYELLMRDLMTIFCDKASLEREYKHCADSETSYQCDQTSERRVSIPLQNIWYYTTSDLAAWWCTVAQSIHLRLFVLPVQDGAYLCADVCVVIS